MSAEGVCITRGELSALMSAATARRHQSCSKLAANSAPAPAFNPFVTRPRCLGRERGGGRGFEGAQRGGEVMGRERVSGPIGSAELKIPPGATANISPIPTLRGG